MAQAQRSSYGTRQSSGSNASSESVESKTTHYAYRLLRDADGNVDKSQGVNGKEYVNEMQIYENEGQYGKFLKIRVTGPIPTDDLYVARKKGK